MDPHFRAFSFVDRITSVEPGTRIRGTYSIPPRLNNFPASLAAEAVGQLAAWCAMAALNFERRPVAGIAGRVNFLNTPAAGQLLELTADLETVDQEAVSYCGSAQVGQTTIVQLDDCVGPMVPVVDFDDPSALRDRFGTLCGPGATPGGFEGVPSLELNRADGEAGQRLRATLQVPAAAPMFADHFPRRPVLPGSLLMHVNLQLAAALAAEMSPPGSARGWKLSTISDVKLRTFVPPGETLHIEVRVKERSEGSVLLNVETRNGSRVVGGARVLLVPKEEP